MNNNVNNINDNYKEEPKNAQNSQKTKRSIGVDQSELSVEDMRSSRWVVAHSNAQIVIGNVSKDGCSPDNLEMKFKVSLQSLKCYYVFVNIGDRNNIKKWRSVHKYLLQVNETYINDTFAVFPAGDVLSPSKGKDIVQDTGGNKWHGGKFAKSGFMKKDFNSGGNYENGGDGDDDVKKSGGNKTKEVFVVKAVSDGGGGYEEPPLNNHLVVNTYEYSLEKEPTGESYVRILLVGSDPDDLDRAQLIGGKSQQNIHYSLSPYKKTAYVSISPGRYSLIVERGKEEKYNFFDLDFYNGGKYTVVVNKQTDNVVSTLTLIDLLPNQVSIWYQLPQYILITIGEALFSVSGIMFAYSQAPNSMKSVVQAMWLLCTAFGNLLDVLITSTRLIPDQATEFFFFAIINLLTIISFVILASFYQYVEQDDETKDSKSPPNDNKSNYDSRDPILSTADDDSDGGFVGEVGKAKEADGGIGGDKVDDDVKGEDGGKDGEKSEKEKSKFPGSFKEYIGLLQNYISNLTR